MQDDTTNILLFLAQGFEDLEAIAVLDVFAWTQYRENIKKVSVTTTGFHPVVRSRFGLKVEPDLFFSEVDSKDYQALVLPGGFRSHGFDETYDTKIHNLARKIHQRGGYIATMCVGILPNPITEALYLMDLASEIQRFIEELEPTSDRSPDHRAPAPGPDANAGSG